MIARAIAAVGLPLLWHNWLLSRSHLNIRGRTAANAVFATAYAAGFGVRGGERDADLLSGAVDYDRNTPADRCDAASGYRGLCWGTALSAATALGYAAALTVPSARRRLAESAVRVPDVDLAEWVGVHIPIGTVYSEELIFRDVLDPLLDRELGRYGIWIGATVFGLWHIAPARAAGDGVPATVAATTLAGLALSLLRRHTGGVIAPALAHLAVNAGGAITARVALRGRNSGEICARAEFPAVGNRPETELP